ncbi:unnamed protein product [Soboliphyme baturini]|uniref:G_PROTEIN_RECEP_F1_2 domain-containing protein n=1 Tax=Soboliphyme baturini TaxID=241478 RepID=A0A183IYZ4_9BILA|nr:unnamed protein product [Soboliphyme baturini]
MYSFQAIKGVINYCSLCSDLVNLVLTAERYMIVRHPVFWHSRSSTWKRGYLQVMVPTCFLLSVVRLDQALKHSVMTSAVPHANRTESIVMPSSLSETVFYHEWVFVSAFVLPVIILTLECYFTSCIVLVLKRRQNLVHNESIHMRQVRSTLSVEANVSQTRSEESSNMTIIVIITAVTCSMAQLAYIVDWIIDCNQILVNPEQDDINIRWLLTVDMEYYYGFLIVGLAEFVSRCMPFYCYVTFNQTFREQVKKSLCRF